MKDNSNSSSYNLDKLQSLKVEEDDKKFSFELQKHTSVYGVDQKYDEEINKINDLNRNYRKNDEQGRLRTQALIEIITHKAKRNRPDVAMAISDKSQVSQFFDGAGKDGDISSSPTKKKDDS